MPRPLVYRALTTMLRPQERWQAMFALLRHSSSEGAFGPLAQRVEKIEKRLVQSIADNPIGVTAYLQWVTESKGKHAAEAAAQDLAAAPNVSAAALVALAHFNYADERWVVGDALLARAKLLSPNLLAAHAEEAWNQRFRENIHREIHAVERCIALAMTAEERFGWEIWLGQALLRRNDPAGAWQHLSDFERLPEGDDRLYSAASAARQTQHLSEALAALRRAAPAPGSPTGIDREVVAQTYLTIHPSAEDAAWVLAELAPDDKTRLFELSAQAELRAGRPEAALTQLAAAAARPDCGAWVPGTRGALYELLGRSDDALKAYLDGADRPVDAIRAGSLLVARGEHERAVRHALSGSDPQFVLDEALEQLSQHSLRGEVDPALPELTARAGESELAGDLTRATDLCKGTFIRASSAGLRTIASRGLAAAHAVSGNWTAAWDALLAGADRRLPHVPLLSLDELRTGFSAGVKYAEAQETEPIATDIVLYESSLGANTGCNPLALCRELLATPPRPGLRHVWAVTSDAALHPSLLDRNDIVFVLKGSPGYFRYLAIAGTIVNNSTLPYEFQKRPGQRVLNTWHGVPWKTLGRDNRSEPAAYGNISRNFLHSDFILCADPHTRDVLSRGMDVDELIPDSFIDAAPPRLDLTLQLASDRRRVIRSQLGAGPDDRVVAYLPTWQGEFLARDAQVASVIAIAEELSGPGIRVALRAHHYVRSAFATAKAPAGVSYVPETIDTNELIGVADVVVTDFSSVLFDAAATGTPVVLLTSALEAYAAERGLYFPARSVPGQLAADTKALRPLVDAAISQPERFVAHYAAQTERFGGRASAGAARAVAELLFAPSAATTRTPTLRTADRTRVLLSVDGLPENGITRSLRSLLANLAGTQTSAYLRPWPSAVLAASPEVRAELTSRARLLYGVGAPAGTRMEQEALSFFQTRHFVDTPYLRDALISGRKREGQRRFGESQFTSAVDFGGYLSSNIALIGYGAPVTRSRAVVFHNEMLPEIRNKYPQLASGMQVLDAFDVIASVSDGVRDANAASLHAHFGVPRELHQTIENTLDLVSIRALAEAPLEVTDESWYARPGKHVCVVARMSPEKNHVALLEALAECRSRLSTPVFITLLGDGPLRVKLEQRAAELEVADIVRFRGQVRAPQSHLKRADALFLPSLHEGQPLVVLEALTVACPVVATDTPGSRSALHGGKFGVLVPISQEGIVSGLQRIARGELVSASGFDADEFTRHSVEQFHSVLGLPRPEEPHRE
ncbi:CDP-glycerol glycerophosphotransferase (TagB/SpsB family) [Leucobacter luti]|uniref:glycosyltransferase n=1 Tax=Leucobacter luti TaxID=340320 RepID=UPI00104BA938|nr:glycosyltransferase [Leucobacter luti]MCW2289852.1 glycosyltransferase involved in cell wall biosynthesis [Leucobacter luti]TCK36021.1 CDP-glycerol glycerophosphotransferase (TagB/SpsB family) [Leucobacter luti]